MLFLFVSFWGDFVIYSGKPSFQISSNLKEIFTENATALLNSAGWSQFEFNELKLQFKPIAFFTYSILDSEKKILKTESSAFDSINFSLHSEFFEYFSKFEKQLGNQLPGNFLFEFKKLEVSEEMLLQKIFSILSEKEGVSKDFLKIDKLTIAYFPFCFLSTSLKGQHIVFEAVGIDGKILNGQIVPLREKNFFEIMQDLISDLTALKKGKVFGKSHFVEKKESPLFLEKLFVSLLTDKFFQALLIIVFALVLLTLSK